MRETETKTKRDKTRKKLRGRVEGQAMEEEDEEGQRTRSTTWVTRRSSTRHPSRTLRHSVSRLCLEPPVTNLGVGLRGDRGAAVGSPFFSKTVATLRASAIYLSRSLSPSLALSLSLALALSLSLSLSLWWELDPHSKRVSKYRTVFSLQTAWGLWCTKGAWHHVPGHVAHTHRRTLLGPHSRPDTQGPTVGPTGVTRN